MYEQQGKLGVGTQPERGPSPASRFMADLETLTNRVEYLAEQVEIRFNEVLYHERPTTAPGNVRENPVEADGTPYFDTATGYLRRVANSCALLECVLSRCGV